MTERSAWQEYPCRSVPSAALGRELPVVVLLPPDCEGSRRRYPVVYLLHGKNGNEREGLERLKLTRYLRDERLIFVMPGATRSFYVDSSDGAYATAIARDLVSWVDRQFPTIPSAAAHGVAGQSMGGYGALYLTVRYPDVFGAGYAIEPALLWGQRILAEWRQETADVDHLLTAAGEGRAQWDLFQLVCRASRDTLDRLRWRIAAGSQDYFLDICRAFHHFLSSWHVPHGYAEYPGGHTFEFGQERLPELLDWFGRELSATPDPG